MLAEVVRIHWHDKKAIFSVDFDPRDSNHFASAGGDNNIWRLKRDGEGRIMAPEYCATLCRHIKSVNCVRFSPSGEILASAGDGGNVIFWKCSENPISQSKTIFGGDGEDTDTEASEYWRPVDILRSSDVEDIYDICWSPCGSYILLGLTDNSAQIWDIGSKKCIRVLKDHQHFVQGVCWDPLGKYCVTQSCDRSVKIWQVLVRNNGNLQVLPINKFHRLNEGEKAESLFHDETLVTFFRRPSFSPDGSLLILPAGIKKTDSDTVLNVLYIVTRGNINKTLDLQIGGFERPVLGIRFNPRLFINESSESLFNLPYRMVYAAYTMDTVYVFDTRQEYPIASFKDLHYGSVTDIAWSCDGYTMVVSSTDGFCSYISFDLLELGSAISVEEQVDIINNLKEIHNPGVKRKTVIPHLSNVMQLVNISLTSQLPSSDPIVVDLPPPQSEQIAINMPSDTTELTLKDATIKRRIQPTFISNIIL